MASSFGRRYEKAFFSKLSLYSSFVLCWQKKSLKLDTSVSMQVLDSEGADYLRSSQISKALKCWQLNDMFHGTVDVPRSEFLIVNYPASQIPFVSLLLNTGNSAITTLLLGEEQNETQRKGHPIDFILCKLLFKQQWSYY